MDWLTGILSVNASTQHFRGFPGELERGFTGGVEARLAGAINRKPSCEVAKTRPYFRVAFPTGSVGLDCGPARAPRQTRLTINDASRVVPYGKALASQAAEEQKQGFQGRPRSDGSRDIATLQLCEVFQSYG